MKKYLKQWPYIYEVSKCFYQAIKAFPTPSRWSEFKRSFQLFTAAANSRFSCRWEDAFPCLCDKTGKTFFDRHYVYHTAWAARILAERKPLKHVDISSCLRFATQVSAFIPIDFYDYRPADLQLDNIESRHADIVSLPFEDNSLSSLSCMHVVEHIGLGRYGDPIDPDGDIKAMAELSRVLAPEGELLFVVPIGGNARVLFNAHRIYTYDQIVEFFPNCELLEFALIPDDEHPQGLIRFASPASSSEQSYGCGCFRFRKKQ